MPFLSLWFTGNFLDSAAALACASLGAFITFRMRLFNLGGEGQIYLGGLVSSALILALKNSVQGAMDGALVLFAAAVSSAVCGALLGAFSGILKKRAGASELLSTFLLSAALLPVCDSLSGGVFRDKGGNLLASAAFGKWLTLPRLLPPSNLSISFIISPLLVFAFFIYLTRTGWGYRFRMAGSAPLFARFGGIDYGRYVTPSLALSAALHSLAGFFLCAGSAGRLHQGFVGGAGWNAIAVALLAGKTPLFIIPVSIIFSAALAWADNALLLNGLPPETKKLLEALFLVIAASIRFSSIFGKRLIRKANV